jgi:hypothetical protein
MHSGQRKPCRAVVECCRRPAHRRVARGAVRCREGISGGRVRRSIGLLPGRQMATGVSAIGRGDRQRVIVIDVAKIARHGCMAVSQGEAG